MGYNAIHLIVYLSVVIAGYAQQQNGEFKNFSNKNYETKKKSEKY